MTTQKAEIQTTQTEETETNFSVFGKKEAGEIFVPDAPMVIRNNCQSGRWATSSKEFDGAGLEIAILKYTKLFGSLGMTENAWWGQIWFVAEAAKDQDFPLGMVACTYIKSRSLGEFESQLAIVGSRGIDPGLGLFMPAFQKASTMKPDDNGVMKAANYYYLSWDWKERKTPEEKERLAPFGRLVLESRKNPLLRAKLVDIQGEANLGELQVAPAEPVALSPAIEVPALASAQ